jgi:serine/threonine protein kinase
VFLILEYAENGNLFNFLKNLKTPLDAKTVSKMYKGICEAILEVHKLGMVHRDLKPENILLDDNLVPKICDFGWSVEIGQDEKRGTFCGTYEYMAPEIYENEKYNVSVDVWSLGILLYEMFHGFSPFSSKSVFKIYRNIVEEDIKFKPDIDEDARDLIFKILKTEPNQRPSVHDILNHKFITKFSNSLPIDSKSKRMLFVKKKENLYENLIKTPILESKTTKSKIIKKPIQKSNSKSKYNQISSSQLQSKKKTNSNNMNIYVKNEDKEQLDISVDSYDCSDNDEKKTLSSKDVSIDKNKFKKNSSNLYNKNNESQNLYDINKKPKLNKSTILNYKTFQDNDYITKTKKEEVCNNLKPTKNKLNNKISRNDYNGSRTNIKKQILSKKLTSLTKIKITNDLNNKNKNSFNSDKINTSKRSKKTKNNSLINCDKSLNSIPNKSNFYHLNSQLSILKSKEDSTKTFSNNKNNKEFSDSSLSKDNFKNKTKKKKINDLLNKYLKDKTKFNQKKNLKISSNLNSNFKTLKNNEIYESIDKKKNLLNKLANNNSESQITNPFPQSVKNIFQANMIS